MHTLNFLTAGIFLIFATTVIGQKLRFVSPAQDTVVKPGQKLTLKLQFQSPSSSDTQIAWELGLNGFANDPTSLGRPLVASLGAGAAGATYKSDEQTYYWDVTLPTADKFLDGFDKTYQLTFSQYFLDKSAFSPMLNTISVPVKLQKA
ncbi:uncharacterized protein MELLADRAFT_55158 [Melampsora larici-populina 98AG31]|uniref:Secreted protein n=1 Tax=Melampsora larici-populina (strain 98AG31 / pathotype 3-4-7) TaxID=747676 RepID=F4RBN9_MELLP|nr:uncharacterized protein MELLADRAFT_55158 [Melampsora larici-populina 98AG31]EGG10300.1 secreted protein [Melampsora larici-populina 98AG31]